MSMFNPPPAPKTPLGHRRLLSPTAGVRVSPLCLGGMSLGSKWADMTGKITKDAAFELLDAFVEAGGNFIDTANLYHFGESEEWIGEWMESRGNRDRLVIATKYSGFNDGETKDVNSMGNHLKSMHLGVRESLKRLRTSYIDVFYVHFWDYSTTVDEVMRGLHRHVMSGEILYPAISDTPAWIVVSANDYARQHGYTPFVLYQGLWNLSKRDVEREIIPMLRKEGMGFAPWGMIGQGKFMSSAQLAERKASNEPIRGGQQSESDIKISEALAKIGDELGVSVTAVALAWAFKKMPYVFPIVGGRKIEHLKDNIKALEITLTDQHVQELEAVTPFEFGFPYDAFGRDPHFLGETQNRVMKASDPIQWVQGIESIESRK